MRLLRFALVALAAAGITASGCRTSIAPVCRQKCVCSKCTENDLDACVEKGEAAQLSAEAKDCAEAFDTFLGCFETNVSCELAAGIGDKCVRAEDALVLCSGDGNPFATICEKATAKSFACQNSKPPPDTKSLLCTGVAECQSKCLLDAECDVITGMKFDQAFNDCVSACLGLVPNKGKPPQPGDGGVGAGK